MVQKGILPLLAFAFLHCAQDRPLNNPAASNVSVRWDVGILPSTSCENSANLSTKEISLVCTKADLVQRSCGRDLTDDEISQITALLQDIRICTDNNASGPCSYIDSVKSLSVGNQTVLMGTTQCAGEAYDYACHGVDPIAFYESECP